MTKGFFVVIEGMDAIGKTFLSKSIYDILIKKGCSVVQTREPGGGEISEAIRKIIFSEKGDKLCKKAETLLFLASRAQNVHDVIRPNLKKGKIVLCDRFTISTIVYQGIIKQKEILPKIRLLAEYAVGTIKPNLTIFMVGKAETAFNRRKLESNEVNRYDKKTLKFFKAVEKAYEKEMETFGKRNAVLYLDSNKKMHEKAESAAAKILSMIQEK